MKLTLFILLVFSFNLIQTIGAFAGTMLAMPFAILLLGPEQARLILTAVGILSCIYPVLSCRSFIDWKEVRKIVKERIEGGANEKAVLRLFINCPFVCINFDFFWLNKARQLYMDF